MKKTVFVDDLTGDEASTTLSFGLDDTMYEIDLNDDNAQELRETLDKYVKVARKKDDEPKRTRAEVVGTDSNSREIRRWAKKQGYNIKGFGRIPQKVMREWEASQGNSPRRRREDVERERALSRNRNEAA